MQHSVAIPRVWRWEHWKGAAGGCQSCCSCSTCRSLCTCDVPDPAEIQVAARKQQVLQLGASISLPPALAVLYVTSLMGVFFRRSGCFLNVQSVHTWQRENFICKVFPSAADSSTVGFLMHSTNLGSSYSSG